MPATDSAKSPVPLGSNEIASGVRRYERKYESDLDLSLRAPDEVIPFDHAPGFLTRTSMLSGSRKLLLGLLRTGTTRIFPGGGIGIEYGSLLKTAARPDDIGDHVREVAAHLRERSVDVLLVPGMSGYPVGSMYAYAAGIPALLLKKQKLSEVSSYPPGSFIIPSYTGEGDVVMSADLDAARDIVQHIVRQQIATHGDAEEPTIRIRCAGAD